MGPRKRKTIGKRGPKKVQGTAPKKTRPYRESQRKNEAHKRAIQHLVECDDSGGSSELSHKKTKLEPLPTFVNNFHSAIQDVCKHVCVSCGGLFFSHSVAVRSIEWIQEQLLSSNSKVSAQDCADYIDSLLDRDPLYFCDYCRRTVAKRKLPCLSMYNGVGFPNLPEYIANLTDVEEKLVAPRIPFLRVQKLGKGGQKSLLGNIVNVEHNMDTSCQVIPRQFHELCVVNVELMRRKEYTKPFSKEHILPEKVLNAAKYLVQTPVYKDLKITLSDAWIREKRDAYFVVPTITSEELRKERHGKQKNLNNKLAISVGSDSDDSSDEEIIDQGFQASTVDTKGVKISQDDQQPCCSSSLQTDQLSKCSQFNSDSRDEGLGNDGTDFEVDSCAEEIEENSESDTEIVDAVENMCHEDVRFCADNQSLMIDLNSPLLTVRFAPCENERVIPLTIDKDPDILCFPSAYGGQYRVHKLKKPSIKKIKKTELRCCKRPKQLVLHIFHAFKMCFNSDIYNCIRVYLRKQTVGSAITASNAMSTEFLKSIFKEDRGYTAFKQVRCTPSYWQAQGKKAVAMGRQFGKATFFITLTPAESRWADLLVGLLEIVKNLKIPYEDVRRWLQCNIDEKPDIGLTPGLIHDCITSDPVTCLRHFYRRFECFQKYVLKAENGVFASSKIQDFFWRVEFQQRGSPHIHGVTWNQDAPDFSAENADSFQDCVEYIDNYITTTRNSGDNFKHVIPYQIHKHSFTCKKKSKSSCRFGFPRPPLPSTMILIPTDGSSEKTGRSNFQKIQNLCDELGRDYTGDMTFQEFLTRLELTFDEYILALRYSIVRATVFMKRAVNAAFVNNYNDGLLLAWEANMDIQYVIDGFATMRYIVGYMLKCESRMSKALSKIMKSYQLGRISGHDKLKMIANAFTNDQCVSAQEAVQYVLSLPCVFTSRSEVYVANNKPDQRIRLLKTKTQLEKLDPDSEDVLACNLILRYAARPKELEQVCLAEFAGYYELDRRSYNCGDEPTEDFAETANWTFEDDTAVFEEGSKTIGKRYLLANKLGKVYRRSVCKVIRFRHYNKLSQTEDYFRSQLFLYHPWRKEESEIWCMTSEKMTAEMEENIETNQKLIYKDSYNENIVEILRKAAEEDDFEYGHIFEDEYGVNPSEAFETNEFGTTQSNIPQCTRSIELIEENEYRGMMRSLNSKQRIFVLEFMTRLKNIDVRNEQFCVFLNGGAGVGKSHAIHAILQTYKRYQNKQPSENPDREWTIVAAYTGKAAFNIGGVTLHSAFRFGKNVKTSSDVTSLADPTINELRNRYRELKLIVIDEISMCSNLMLNIINMRMKQIMDNQKDFGGLSVLVVGDLRQLAPVMAPGVFEPFIKLPEKAKAIRKWLPRDVTINPLWKKFEFYKLTEVMRQKDDVPFMHALNHMAVGKMTEKDVDLIRTREVDSSEIPFETTRLYHSNDDCDSYNESVYRMLSTEGVDSIAFDEVNGRVGPAQVKNCQDFAKNMNRHQSDGIPYKVHLKLEATYFITTNVDVADGLFNGSTGVLKLIQYGPEVDGLKNPIRAWLDFKNPSIGKRARENYRGYLPEGALKEWVPVEKIHRDLSREKLHFNARITRHQLPLWGANGMTIHKSQGSTLGTVAVSCKRKLSRQLIYVACSRATSLKGLFIHGGKFKKPSPPWSHDKVEVELKHLNDFPFIPSIRNFTTGHPEGVRIFFANITSFRPVAEDIEADEYLMKSDMMFFVEPKLLTSDIISLAGFLVDTRINCTSTRNSEGILAFRNSNVNSEELALQSVYQDYEQKGHFIVVCWKIRDIFLYVFYKSPNYALENCKDVLLGIAQIERQKTVMVGDINWNFGSIGQVPDVGRRKFLCELGKLNFLSLIPFCKASTDNGTTIDVAFSNIQAADAWFYELYFNYHKGICSTLPFSG